MFYDKVSFISKVNLIIFRIYLNTQEFKSSIMQHIKWLREYPPKTFRKLIDEER